MEMIFQEPGTLTPERDTELRPGETELAPEPPVPEPVLALAEPAPPEPLVIADPELLTPEGERWITHDSMFPPDKDDKPIPHFSVSEASKFFFGNGPDWLRWRMRPDDHKAKGPDGKFLHNDDGSFVMVPGNFPEGFFVLDGIPIQPKRSEAGARYFTLADIERMAVALAQNGFMDGAQLTNIMVLVKTCAKVYGYVE